jgi:hypothetical protein
LFAKAKPHPIFKEYMIILEYHSSSDYRTKLLFSHVFGDSVMNVDYKPLQNTKLIVSNSKNSISTQMDSIIKFRLGCIPADFNFFTKYKLEKPVTITEFENDSFRKLMKEMYKKNKDTNILFMPDSKPLLQLKTNESLFFLLRDYGKGFPYEYRVTHNYEIENTPWQNLVDTCILKIPPMTAGDYVLEVRNLKLPDHPTDIFEFKVIPIWYQTNQFYWILSNIAVLLLGWFFIIQYKKRKKHQVLKAQQEAKENSVKLSAIHNQLNPHFIFNTLNSLQGLILDNNTKEATFYIQQLSTILRKPLSKEALSVWSLQDELELIKSYISLEQLRVKFTLHYHEQEHIFPDNIAFPSMMLQSIVENCIKHSLASIQPAGTLHFAIETKQLDLIIAIADNGAAASIKAGNGLTILQEYITHYNATNAYKKIEMTQTQLHGTTTIFTCKNFLEA